MQNSNKILDLLLKANIITEDQIDTLLKEQKTTGETIDAVLEKKGIINQEEILDLLSSEYKLPAIDLRTYEIDSSLLELVPQNISRKYRLIPVKKRGRLLTVAVSEPWNTEAITDLRFVTGYEIEPVLASPKLIKQILDQQFGVEDTLSEILESLEEEMELIEEEEKEPDVLELTALIEEAPVVKFVNGIILDAIRHGASDIHIEPYEKMVRVRVRVDGVLNESMPIPYRFKDAVVSRIKVMSKLDIAERRLPQDGHIKMKVGERAIDLRVSTLPTLFGEKVVMRILDKSAIPLDLSRLGFEEGSLEKFKEAILHPYGLILVTGPTGSGKTTTLYSAINMLNNPEVNIMTVEDPVEYDFPGINQVNVKEEIGLNFAYVLRSFLRQDPDIILVGEIRDSETAGIAIKAALTGHLVLSTLHTNDAPSSVSRLIDMGMEPFLVSASLLLVQAQRLIRKICTACKRPTEIPPEVLARVGLAPEDIEGKLVYKGVGCTKCNNSGYSGREGIYEVMTISPDIREMIIRNAPIHEIKAKAIEEGMLTLRDAAIQKLFKGTTSIDEVIRVTSE